jgi:peptide/nickel transport system permease protein
VTKYILNRIAVAIPLILAIVTIVFLMLRLGLPGDPAKQLAGDRATPELIERIRTELGLDRPLPEQYLIFMRNAIQGDLGDSSKFRQPVVDLLADAFPFTAMLTLLTVGIGTFFGVVVGVITAIWRKTLLDSLTMVVVIFFYSIPTFWMGLMLILIFSVQMRLLPVQGSGSWQHFILPVATLAVNQVALIARLTRSSLVETLSMDFIRTARSKGLNQRSVLLQHALRNTLIPVVTVTGLSVGALLGGAVITETIFGLPGIGRQAIQAINNRDYPMIQGTVILVAVSFVFVNLIVDILYVYIDPRIRYD